MPSLQKRTRRRKQQKGNTHRGRQHAQNSPHRLFAAMWLPNSAGHYWQEQRAGQEKQRMSPRRKTRPTSLNQNVGIQIPKQIYELVERKADYQNRRPSSKHRQIS